MGDASADTAAATATESRARPATRLVVGCGYLGLRVAHRWLAGGDRVFGVTRSEARAAVLAAAGVIPVRHDVTSADPWPLELAPGPDTVFWAVGFDRTAAASPCDVHVTGLGRLLDTLPAGPRVILSSSTGVWGDEHGGVVDERTPVNPGREAGRVLVEAETLLRGHPRGPGVALRFAGLYGPERLPRLDDLRAGRPIPADPDSWLNLLHVDDAAAVVAAVAAAADPRPLYVVSDSHPIRRRDWYAHLARLTGSPAPRWDPAAPRSRGADKRVDPAAVYDDLGISPGHPDPLAGIAAALAATD